MTLAEFIKENRNYMDETSLANLEGMSDDDFAALCLLNEEVFGDDEPGISSKIIRVAFGSVASFDEARENWREKGQREELTADGRLCAIYTDVQAAKGQQRKTIAVMPQGEAAIVLEG